MNTELLIKWNHLSANSTTWQFGQILPMFLVVLPLVGVIKAFRKYKLQKRTHRRKVHHKSRAGKQEEDNPVANGLGRGAPSSSPFARSRPGPNLFASGFPPLFAEPISRPDGGMPAARISQNSIHTGNSLRSHLSGNDSSSDSSDSDSDSSGSKNSH